MATANPKIILSRSQDIPFNNLVLSRANVRRVKAGISIEDLAEDIANRSRADARRYGLAAGAATYAHGRCHSGRRRRRK